MNNSKKNRESLKLSNGSTAKSVGETISANQLSPLKRSVHNEYSLLTKTDILNESCYKLLAAAICFEECIDILTTKNVETDKWIMAKKAFTFHFLKTKGRKVIKGIDTLFYSLIVKRDEFADLTSTGNLFDLNCIKMQSYSEKTKIHITHLQPILEHLISCGYGKKVLNFEVYSSFPYFTVDLTPLTIDFYSSFLKENIAVIDSKIYENLLRNLTYNLQRKFPTNNKNFELKMQDHASHLANSISKIWKYSYEYLDTLNMEDFIKDKDGYPNKLRIINSSLTVNTLISTI